MSAQAIKKAHFKIEVLQPLVFLSIVHICFGERVPGWLEDKKSVKVRRFKEGLEKLRVEAKAQFIREQEKIEQKEADEIVTIGFARKIIQQGRADNYSG